MSTSKTWPGGGTAVTPTAYSIPAAGELNWASLSDFLNALGDGAQSTTFQKFAVRKATTSPVTVSASTDCSIVTDLSVAGAVTVNLPAGANKQLFIIADGKGDAGTNNITINRSGSDTIMGATSLVLNANREFVFLIFNSADTDWKVVARGNGQAAFVNPMDSAGDMIVGGASGVATKFDHPGGASYVINSTGATSLAWTQTPTTTAFNVTDTAPRFNARATASGNPGLDFYTSTSSNRATIIFNGSSNALEFYNIAVSAGSPIFSIADSGSGNVVFSAGIQAASGVITGNLTVDTNTLFVDSSNNRVGIGTTSPSTNAEVRAASSPRYRVADTGTGNPGYEFYTSTSSGRAVILFNDTSDALEFYNLTNSGGTPAFTVTDGAGNNVNFNNSISIAGGSTLAQYVDWTSVAFSAGNFTSSNVGAWTVESGDQITYKYMILGKTMFLNIGLTNTSLSANSDSLSVAIPASKTAAAETRGHLTYVDANVSSSTLVDAFWDIQSSGTTIRFLRAGTSGTPWATNTNQLSIYVSAVFEIS